jgi:hypothetical protein
VKRVIADGSVGFPHVRVGHRQASKKETPAPPKGWGFAFMDMHRGFRYTRTPAACLVTNRQEGAAIASIARKVTQLMQTLKPQQQ